MLLAMYEGWNASGVNEGLNPDLYWKWKKGLHKPYTGRWFFFLTKYSFPNTVLKNFGILQICRTVPYRNKIPENAGACWGHLKEYILMFISINLGLWYWNWFLPLSGTENWAFPLSPACSSPFTGGLFFLQLIFGLWDFCPLTHMTRVMAWPDRLNVG